MKYLFFSGIFFVLLFLAGCVAPVYIEKPKELADVSKLQSFYDLYSVYFKGKTFFIDPGHGGTDRKSVGPNKLVTEADINLKVGLHLAGFLRQLGASVVLSRDRDTFIDLKDRSMLANSSGANFFISIHHNAPGRSEDTDINYTSTYYHALETDYEFEPMERDLARFIQRDLSYAMRNSGGLGSFDGTYSDYNIYPKQGFAVLRNTVIPSVLVECSFFTNPYEERRLAEDEFNKIQAFGIARGIARYLKTGYPEIQFVRRFQKGEGEYATFMVKDSSTIDIGSLKVLVDSSAIRQIAWSEKKDEFTFPLPSQRTDNSVFYLSVKNVRGNSSFVFRKKLFELQ